MAEITAEIVVKAVTDGAKKGLTGVAGAATQMARGLGAVASQARASAKQVAQIVSFAKNLGAGLVKLKEIGRAAFEVGRQLVTSALEMRGASDPIVKEFERMGKTAKGVKAVFGDVLLPIVLGIGRALTPLAEQVRDWALANRQLIATNVAEYVAGFFDLIAGPGLKVMQGITGMVDAFKVAWYGVQVAGNAAFEALLSGVQKVLKAGAAAADLIGSDGLAGTLGEAAKAAGAFGNEFAMSGEAASKAMQESAQALVDNAKATDDLRDRVRNMGRTISAEIIKAAKTVKSVTKEVKTFTVTTADAINRAWGSFTERLSQPFDEFSRLMEMRNNDIANALDKQKAKVEELKATYQEVGTTISDAFGGAFAAATVAARQGTGAMEAFSDALRKNIIRTATDAITSYAVQAAAGAAASLGPLGVVGIAGVGVLAGAFKGIVEGFLADLPKAARGGLVTGGIPGVDSVPIMTQPGEMVLTPAQTQEYIRSGGGGRSGGNTYNLHFHGMLGTEAEITRAARDKLIPAINRAEALAT